MNEVKAFELLVGISWDMGYADALKFCQENECFKVVQTKNKAWIEIVVKCGGNEFGAWLIFEGFFKKLKKIKLDLFQKDFQKKLDDATQMLIDEFLQTYYVLFEKLGKADSQQGISLEELKDLDYLGGANFKKLPYFEWQRGTSLIKHGFAEKEGVEIATRLEPKK